MLEAWIKARFIQHHESSPQEIGELLDVMKMALSDARIVELSPDRRCYSALLAAARAALPAAGYRVSKGNKSHHYYTVPSLQYTVGWDALTSRKIERLGKKRATAEYVRVGTVSPSMAEEALAFAEEH